MRLDINKYFKKYQIQLPKDVRKLPKGLIISQNNMYERAADEILELCNETMLAKINKQKDDFKSPSHTNSKFSREEACNILKLQCSI